MSVYEELVKAKDEAYREFQAKLVPNIDASTIIGVRTPDMRRIAKETFRSEERDAFLQDVPHRFYEEKLVHFFMLAMIKDFDECVKKCFRRVSLTGRCL